MYYATRSKSLFYYPCLESQVLVLILVLKGQVLVLVLVLVGSVLVNLTDYFTCHFRYLPSPYLPFPSLTFSTRLT